MPVDPRRTAGANGDERVAQRLADLEKRVGQLSMATKGAVLATGIASQTGSPMTVTTTATDIAGLTLATSAEVATLAVVQFAGYLSIDYTTTYANNIAVHLWVNGVKTLTPVGYLGANTPSGLAAGTYTISGTVNCVWRVSLPAGSNALKVQAALSNSGTSGRIYNATLSHLQTRA